MDTMIVNEHTQETENTAYGTYYYTRRVQIWHRPMCGRIEQFEKTTRNGIVTGLSMYPANTDYARERIALALGEVSA